MAKSKVSKAQRDKGNDEFAELAAVDFKPLPGKFDVAAFNETMETNRQIAYLAVASLHKTKPELVQAWSDIPEIMAKLGENSSDTARRLRALADNLDAAHARILGACAAHLTA